ncbi:MAG: hypothetical protein MK077_09960 [Phycisphaerales bacterium]|nr:hypothetical protein [Phycisphaerales bacterium]
MFSDVAFSSTTYPQLSAWVPRPIEAREGPISAALLLRANNRQLADAALLEAPLLALGHAFALPKTAVLIHCSARHCGVFWSSYAHDQPTGSQAPPKSKGKVEGP